MARTAVKPPIPYYGAKVTLAPWIVASMPPHSLYVEVFGGSGAVLLAKPRSAIEIYNDVSDTIVNFFLQVQRDPVAILERLTWIPVARTLCEAFNDGPLAVDPVERAARLFYCSWLTIPGRTNRAMGRRKGTGFALSASVNGAARYEAMKPRLAAASERLRGVGIECQDFRELIARYDRLHTLFYCDPPYVGEESNFPGGFLRGDHLALADLLKGSRGTVLVSYADHPLVRELYSGWTVRERRIRSRIADSRGMEARHRVELLLCNRPFPTLGLQGFDEVGS